jgi:hypothetical protein
MTSAKPHSMAAQTDAPDDLIAELARLMADDARDNQPSAKAPSTPVRIPGGEPTPVPVPRFDFSASAGLASSKAPAAPVRIPGNDQPAAAPSEPFSFNFDFTPSSRTAAPSPEPVAATPVQPAPLSPPPMSPLPTTNQPAPEQPGPLDQDSLADLIAAELAADMGTGLPARSEEPAVEAPPARPANADTFGVPPVFGLGSAPASVAVSPAAAPSPEPAKVEPPEPAKAISRDDGTPDPLDEIERLVGPAVRMNIGTPAPSPALRSLATPAAPVSDVAPAAPVAPKPTPVEPAVEVSSVDEAILAAAAATGAHVEWVNAGVSEPEGVVADMDDTLPPPRATGFRLNRAIAGPAVAVALLAVAGLGLYWVLGQGGGATGPAPLVAADTTPTKEVPEVEAPAAAQQSVVFNEMSGADASADEQIVSRDQADTEAVVAANTALSSTGVLADVSGATVDPNQDGLVNRKVRTVTVRPDGTIVSGDDSLAGSAILPVDRPNVPEVPGADFSTPDLIASAIAETEPTPAAAATDVTATPAAAAAGPAAEPGSSIAVVDATGAPIAGRTVTVPMQRPDDFPTIAAAALASATAAPATAAPVESATIAAAPAPQTVAPTTTAGSAAAYVQLASQRSEAEAQQTVQAITTRYGVLFGGASPEIRQVDLGERGIFYRVLVPAASREAAANLCTNIKAAGGDCLLL